MRVELHAGAPADVDAVWESLYAPHRGATPFVSPGWGRAWWSHYGDGAQPFFLVAEDAGAPVALAALALRRRGPLRVLETVGMEPGDYWDVLARPEMADAAVSAIAGALAERSRNWDALVVRCLPPGSPVDAALTGAGLRAVHHRPIPAPGIELPADFDAYLAGLPGSRRQNLRRHLRRLDAGEVTLRAVTDPDGVAPALARWREFRRAQWEAQGRAINPEHLSDRFSAFMAAVVGDLLPAGEALLWEFLVDDEIVGTYVNFADRDAFYWYLGGFRPDVAALGLGKIAIGHGIRTSITAGRTYYDFARGAEDYKYWYGAEDRLLPAFVAGSGRVRSRAALGAARLALARRARRSAVS